VALGHFSSRGIHLVGVCRRALRGAAAGAASRLYELDRLNVRSRNAPEELGLRAPKCTVRGVVGAACGILTESVQWHARPGMDWGRAPDSGSTPQDGRPKESRLCCVHRNCSAGQSRRPNLPHWWMVQLRSDSQEGTTAPLTSSGPPTSRSRGRVDAQRAGRSDRPERETTNAQTIGRSRFGS
jgi:hypothetical protein